MLTLSFRSLSLLALFLLLTVQLILYQLCLAVFKLKKTKQKEIDSGYDLSCFSSCLLDYESLQSDLYRLKDVKNFP